MAPEADRLARTKASGLACYRLALRLYPQAFYRQYAEELEADFEEASDESFRAEGAAGLARAWARAWADLPWSLTREWLRTAWPPAVVLATLAASFALYASVFRAYGPLQQYRQRVAAGIPPPQDSPELLWLMLLMVLVPIGSIIIVSGVITLALRRKGRSTRRV